jgi:hypothetical protein
MLKKVILYSSLLGMLVAQAAPLQGQGQGVLGERKEAFNYYRAYTEWLKGEATEISHDQIDACKEDFKSELPELMIRMQPLYGYGNDDDNVKQYIEALLIDVGIMSVDWQVDVIDTINKFMINKACKQDAAVKNPDTADKVCQYTGLNFTQVKIPGDLVNSYDTFIANLQAKLTGYFQGKDDILWSHQWEKEKELTDELIEMYENKNYISAHARETWMYNHGISESDKNTPKNNREIWYQHAKGWQAQFKDSKSWQTYQQNALKAVIETWMATSHKLLCDRYKSEYTVLDNVSEGMKHMAAYNATQHQEIMNSLTREEKTLGVCKLRSELRKLNEPVVIKSSSGGFIRKALSLAGKAFLDSTSGGISTIIKAIVQQKADHIENKDKKKEEEKKEEEKKTEEKKTEEKKKDL